MESQSMYITINGERRELTGETSLAALLAEFELPRGKVAIERNLEIVPKSAYQSTMLADGDRLEIVHFIGGG